MIEGDNTDAAAAVSAAPTAVAAAKSVGGAAEGAVEEERHQASIKIAEEFQYLLEKSQQLFAGLRDLPPTGRNWQPYFQRTFEVYTKLWKFQQQHRAVLENKDYYGLKRSEIGEAASKIGQLYYHYYLRTSETNYLFESYIFYEAIRDRQYFKEGSEGKSLPLMIKKLRYYARFIVVCLLLNRNDMIKKLMEELSGLVDAYIKDYKPTDSAEWNVVLSEISTFLEAEKKLTPIDLKGAPLFTPSRVQIERTSKIDKDGIPKLKLQEAILVGNFQNQIKFSELTLDMYRMLQSLEREPSSQIAASGGGGGVAATVDGNKKDDGAASGGDDSGSAADKNSRRSNPHKYLLYRPTFAQLMLYISTAFKDINDNTAMLVYLSADGAKRNAREHDDKGYTGGIATATNFVRKNAGDGAAATAATLAGGKGTVDGIGGDLVHCLHPNDLAPFTRKPMFLIVDSTNSAAFQNIPRVFSAPLVCLMGPTEYPSSIKDTTQIGSLFTLFLHVPIKAFAFISNITQLSTELWNDCNTKLGLVEKTISDVVEANVSTMDKSYKRFLQDDFLKQFVVRFILCHVLMSCHSEFKDAKQFPIANPPIPNAILSSGDILTKIQELVTLAEVLNLYNFSANGQGGSDRQSAAIAPSAVKPAAAAPSTQPAETSNLAPITAASENNLLEEATEAKE